MKSLCLLIVAAACSACGSMAPWTIPRSAIDVMSSGLEATQDELPEVVGEHFDTIHASLEVGANLVDLWEHGGTEPADWRGWLRHILELSGDALLLIKSLGVVMPPAVGAALSGLQILLPLLGGS